MADLYKPTANVDGMVIQHFGDETLVYDLGAHRAFCLNATAASVWEQCDGSTTVIEMARTLSDQGDPDDDLVWMALDRLAEFDLIKGHPERLYGRHSRRRILQGLGMTALIALPVISTVATPTDNRGTMSACICTANAQCLQPPCSGTCSGVGICM